MQAVPCLITQYIIKIWQQSLVQNSREFWLNDTLLFDIYDAYFPENFAINTTHSHMDKDRFRCLFLLNKLCSACAITLQFRTPSDTKMRNSTVPVCKTDYQTIYGKPWLTRVIHDSQGTTGTIYIPKAADNERRKAATPSPVGTGMVI